jgi:DAPG hydrolase PhiG domain
LSEGRRYPLPHPELVEERPQLRVELVIPDARGDVLHPSGIEERNVRRSVGLRSNFWLGWGLPLSPGELAEEIPDALGLNLMKHAYTEFHYLSRFLPSYYIAERREVETPPLPW